VEKKKKKNFPGGLGGTPRVWGNKKIEIFQKWKRVNFSFLSPPFKTFLADLNFFVFFFFFFSRVFFPVFCYPKKKKFFFPMARASKIEGYAGTGG